MCIWMVCELVDWVGIGGFGLLFVGSLVIVVDLLQEWVEDIDVDGFNLVYVLVYEIFSDVVELLVLELQKCGVYKIEYVLGILCEKLFGDGLWLLDFYLVVGYCDLWVFWEKEVGCNVLLV